MVKKNAFIFCFIFLASWIFLWEAAVCSAFSLEDEKKLGAETYEQLEKNQALMKNERTLAYINRIGNRILAQSAKLPFEYRFSIIRSSAINAFATPGGYIYINRGLINLAENESQLAGVLAHEIAHVNARHIADSIQKAKRVSVATLAGMLAGVLLGGGGDLTSGLISMSAAAGTSASLRYSREHEEEADRLGMLYLTKAGYDPKSMLDFLRIMRRYEYYSNNVPSYFLTHPGTDERVRYLDAAIQTTYTLPGRESIEGGFKRIKTILLIIGSRNQEQNRRTFEEGLKKNPNDIDDLYGLAVTEAKLGRTDVALKHFHRALTLAPRDKDILGDTGITYIVAGRPDEALPFLQESVTLNSDDPEVYLFLAKAYEARGEMEQAIAALRQMEKRNIEDDDWYYNIAMIYGKANNLWESHYYFGQYFKRKNRKESALFHFKAALKHAPPEDGRTKEIEKRRSVSWTRSGMACPAKAKHRQGDDDRGCRFIYHQQSICWGDSSFSA
jgi:predicted Zn-dependent protease